MKKGHKETALRGLHNGGYAPFGYDAVEQQFVVNEFEAEYVRRMFRAAANREGYTAIIYEMEERGIKGKRGKPIKSTQIHEILRNPKYTGTYIYYPHGGKRGERRQADNAITIENAFPAIIDKNLFLEVQQIMSERKQTGKKPGTYVAGLCSVNAERRCTGIGRSAKATNISIITVPKNAVHPA